MISPGSSLDASFRWPPHCCVPAFVHAALLAEGVVPPEPRYLAHAIGVQVGSTDPNPFGLQVTADADERGVKPAHAVGTISRILADCAPFLAFRHVPFTTITFQLFEDVLAEALARRCTVGAGVDPSLLPLPSIPHQRHVVHVIHYSDHRADFVDDSAGAGPPIRVDWLTLERAVHAVCDGFWILGRQERLNLQHCLPCPLTVASRRGGPSMALPNGSQSIAFCDACLVRPVRNENFITHGFNAGARGHVEYMLTSPLFF